ncbi:MAG: elongation factor Ts [Candidatus Yanofskybacteria bacterium CG10_big_fil_rev_8_21_14_0_10_36_16]|uniref:Elongation factor Ts n=1 Tax=Candidatus Yanofskybacteria bacterium CG10_big_fil_rev_8_21_14_0_10_36_16 TaxID=1975096 RepID=A0A2J0Q8D5_9BACT|nr:MAG: elongation factor Ts [Candidatus Yanofskybacteria bacterium CG10_big_fil_rev_8_21_14_0_10_36_16]
MNDIEVIKKIRDMTGFSIGQIKKALEESGGDQARALDILKAHGAVVAAKKESRSTEQGLIGSYVHANGKIATVVSVLCETDFVAKNPMFQELTHEIAMHITAMNPKDVAELLGQEYIRDQSMTIEEFMNQFIAKLGENIKIGKFMRLEI